MNTRTVYGGKRTILDGFLPGILVVFATIFIIGAMSTGTIQGRADNFTDIFYTNSFRGAFEWVRKLDWVGMLVQIVISTFSLFGVALMVIRIMTSMLYLSAKGLWEEVNDLKNEGGDDKDLIGLMGMAKTWKSGKAGTGLDAIIGVVLILLPNVKKYSDFGPKAKGDFSEDCTITQYMLKIALPTVMTVFFFAMGFNGTLFQALAVTVDFMGTLADTAISVNYAGIADDIIDSVTGSNFYFDADGTNLGKFKQAVAKNIYYRLVKQFRNLNPDQLYQMGTYVEGKVKETFPDCNSLAGARGLDAKVVGGLQSPDKDGVSYADAFVNYVNCEVIVSGSETLNGVPCLFSTDTVATEVGISKTGNERVQYVHIVLTASSAYNGAYLNPNGVRVPADTGSTESTATVTDKTKEKGK